ncbi:hypothetical protein KRR26_26115 [Corallococcus sp. M34]|uniref:hypothetical protein n=1 Tax=Citreicoccus inhibens TaxID=2849499 RepID=UPI001C21CD83|nr:hypothetical protein [Citreicoccus inhibens]MBU8899093.1 hypothetical protein [Citreicoccus inhibens]
MSQSPCPSRVFPSRPHPSRTLARGAGLALALLAGRASAQEATLTPVTSEPGLLRPAGAFLGGAAAGAALGLGLKGWTTRQDFPWHRMRGSALLPSLGLGLGAGLGTWTVGTLLDGRGSLLAALAGGVPGTVAAFVGGSQDRGATWVLVGAPVAVLGAVVAYELTTPEALGVLPALAMNANGGGLTLSGAF